jgi:hypothetical protein
MDFVRKSWESHSGGRRFVPFISTKLLRIFLPRGRSKATTARVSVLNGDTIVVCLFSIGDAATRHGPTKHLARARGATALGKSSPYFLLGEGRKNIYDMVQVRRKPTPTFSHKIVPHRAQQSAAHLLAARPQDGRGRLSPADPLR